MAWIVCSPVCCLCSAVTEVCNMWLFLAPWAAEAGQAVMPLCAPSEHSLIASWLLFKIGFFFFKDNPDNLILPPTKKNWWIWIRGRNREGQRCFCPCHVENGIYGFEILRLFVELTYELKSITGWTGNEQRGNSYWCHSPSRLTYLPCSVCSEVTLW